jgi:hypothetical protein
VKNPEIPNLGGGAAYHRGVPVAEQEAALATLARWVQHSYIWVLHQGLPGVRVFDVQLNA